MAQIAKNSSTRAYAGHSHEMRHVFEINSLNLTEFARSFALYKNLQSVGLPIFGKRDVKKRTFSKKDHADKEKTGKEKTVNMDDEKMFSKRLKKSQQKGLEKKMVAL